MENNQNAFILFTTEDEKISVDVRFEEETVWLTQEQMAVLFGKGRSTITEHIRNVFKEGELNEDVVCRDFRLTTQHGAMEGKNSGGNCKTLQSRCNNLCRLSCKIAAWHTVSYLGYTTPD